MKVPAKPKVKKVAGIATLEREPWTKPVVSEIKSGLTLAHVGQQSTGKTLAALEYGYLDLEYEDHLVKAGYGDIVEALKDGLIPEVKKIKMLESEWGTEQLGRPLEDALIGEIWRNKVELKQIDLVTEDVLLSLEGVEDDPESLQLMNKAFDMYMYNLQDIAKSKDRNTMTIVDSMSLFKDLIDTKTGVIFNKRTRGKGEEVAKGVGGQRWTLRNQYWRKALTYLRAMPGWTVATFRELRNSEWAVKAFGSSPYKFVWTPDTGFQMDMVYYFYQDPMTNELNVKTMSDYCRYLYRGDDADDFNNYSIKLGSKLGIFPAIQGMVKVIREQSEAVTW